MDITYFTNESPLAPWLTGPQAFICQNSWLAFDSVEEIARR